MPALSLFAKLIQKVELLAPAGNMECFLAALHFGADAVYIGAKAMNLRNLADNFDGEQLAGAVKIAHAQGKRVYVTLNAFAKDKDIQSLPRVLEAIEHAGPDALIVSDPGVIRVVRGQLPGMPLHLSTQANTLSAEAALFWHDMGISRIVLARELSLDEIKAMRDTLPPSLELEVFVHGAMCMAYSGRCLFSNYINGRSGNAGSCAQPCRWRFAFREAKAGEEPADAFFEAVQDEQGTYLFNSRDLCLISHLPKLIDAGVSSLKIEGRMKSLFYVATVTNAYRMALDHYAAHGAGAVLPDAIMSELNKASHRPYSTGFLFGGLDEGNIAGQSGGYTAGAFITAVVENYNPQTKRAKIIQRNRFFAGDCLEILGPKDIDRKIMIQSIQNEEGETVLSAPHPEQVLFIQSDEPLKKGDILRKIRP